MAYIGAHLISLLAAGLLPVARRQAISIDCCTARQQQTRPLFDPYPQQHGGQQQTQAVLRCQEAEHPLVSDTRSSAIAQGPRDASCQLKSCQLPRNEQQCRNYLYDVLNQVSAVAN